MSRKGTNRGIAKISYSPPFVRIAFAHLCVIGEVDDVSSKVGDVNLCRRVTTDEGAINLIVRLRIVVTPRAVIFKPLKVVIGHVEVQRTQMRGSVYDQLANRTKYGSVSLVKWPDTKCSQTPTHLLPRQVPNLALPESALAESAALVD